MTNDLGSIALTILASIGGLAGLLMIMTLLEPSKMSPPGQRRVSRPARAGHAELRRHASR